MTVICWDGKTLAADKAAGDEWTKFGRMTKIRRIRDHLVGCAGNAALCRSMMAWFEAGAVPNDLPANQRELANNCSMLVITPGGRIHLYQSSPYPMEYEGDYYAIGSGKEAAAAILEFGQDAVTAVEIASRVCNGCGGGVDTLELVAELRAVA